MAVRNPSLRKMEMVAVPCWFSSGVSRMVRLVPAPPSTRLALGTRAGFEERALRVRLSTGVSASRMVKGTSALTVLV